MNERCMLDEGSLFVDTKTTKFTRFFKPKKEQRQA